MPLVHEHTTDVTSKHRLYFVSTKQAIMAGVIILCFYLSLIKL